MSEGRDSTGRFLPGQAIVRSPGRPKRETETRFLDTIISAMSPDKWRGIVDRAITDAIAGDFRARQWLSEYLIGKPPQILALHASDAMLLAEIVRQFGERGITATELFGYMLAEVKAQGDETDE